VGAGALLRRKKRDAIARFTPVVENPHFSRKGAREMGHPAGGKISTG